tara:strand:+ start:182 stop:370 length:189 start_codon:yes stop_codon:yes gene_type:complete
VEFDKLTFELKDPVIVPVVIGIAKLLLLTWESGMPSESDVNIAKLMLPAPTEVAFNCTFENV